MQTEAEALDEPAEEQRRFNTKKMAVAFPDIASAMARFEKMDPNFSAILKVNRGTEDTLT